MMENEPVKAGRQPSMMWVVCIVLGTSMVSGGVAGYFSELRAAGSAVPPSAWLFVLPLFAGLGILLAYLSRFGKFWKNWSSRKKLYWASLILATAMGLLSGMALQHDAAGGANGSLLGNSAIDPGIAIILSIVWIAGMTVSILMYHRSVDDHEKQAYLWGGLAGFYALVFPAPAWWLLARADLAPPVDGMVLFLLALTANAIVYFWLKFR